MSCVLILVWYCRILWLFHGTIYDNIKYGKDDATEQEIIEAAKIANVHDFIMSLPDGYQTFINEEGTNVSQGEKQLITIAKSGFGRSINFNIR